MAMKLRMPTDFGHALPGSRDSRVHPASPMYGVSMQGARRYIYTVERQAQGFAGVNDFASPEWFVENAVNPYRELTEQELSGAFDYFMSLRDQPGPMEPPREKVLDAAVAKIVHEVMNEEIPGYPVYDGPPMPLGDVAAAEPLMAWTEKGPGFYLPTPEEQAQLAEVDAAIAANFRQRNGGDPE